MVSEEKSNVNPIEDPLYVINCFSFTAFKIFCWSSLLTVGLSVTSPCPDMSSWSLPYLEFVKLLGCAG